MSWRYLHACRELDTWQSTVSWEGTTKLCQWVHFVSCVFILSMPERWLIWNHRDNGFAIGQHFSSSLDVAWKLCCIPPEGPTTRLVGGNERSFLTSILLFRKVGWWPLDKIRRVQNSVNVRDLLLAASFQSPCVASIHRQKVKIGRLYPLALF